MEGLKTTNKLLLVLVIPVIFYLLKILHFIFIPLIFGMFIALLFMPLMRKMERRRIPKPAALGISVLIIVAGLFVIGELIKISSNEINSADASFVIQAETKIANLQASIESTLGLAEGGLKDKLSGGESMKTVGNILNKAQGALVTFLMTLFFAVLLLAESLNLQKIMDVTIFHNKITSIRTFLAIEKDLIKFIKVKFVISAFTGLGFSLCCLAFDVSFPVMWGLFAFAINFVQMIGSIIAVICVSIFAFIELDPGGILALFIFCAAMVEVIMGGILEPIFLGKSFKINVVTVLVMLMFWGFIWGIPGLILSIPITVFLKIVLEKFEGTKVIANIISGD